MSASSMYQMGYIPGIPAGLHEKYEYDVENFVF
jgi:hypothetical protein